MVVLVAFPPSPLFLSELMILKQTIADGRWWLVTGIMLLLCLVIYFFCSRLLRLCYQPRQDELHPRRPTAHCRGRRCRCSPPPSGWGFGSPHFSGN